MPTVVLQKHKSVICKMERWRENDGETAVKCVMEERQFGFSPSKYRAVNVLVYHPDTGLETVNSAVT